MRSIAGMKTTKLASFIALTLFYSTAIFANTNLDNRSSIKFFASNNANEIDLQKAFNEIQNKDQRALQNKIIDVMQKNRMEQGKFENILGIYKMSVDHNITADNSEIYITSALQKLSSQKIFKMAKELANTLKQESVAVFMPSKQAAVGDIVLTLKSHAYSITEITQIIHAQLPQSYSKAFSLHLNNICSNFDTATVNKVEWLGSKINPEVIKKIFFQEQIFSHNGKAYLVYENGNKLQL